MPEDRLAAARKARYDRDPAVRRAAVRDLLELALTPGADALAAVLALDDFDADQEARDAIAVITTTVPSPGWPERFEAPPATGVDELWGIADPPAFDPTAWWRRPDRLTVAIGVAPDGHPVRLDLRDEPHVLVVGATGSGKTELLRTIVLGLAATNSPDDVNLLFVDPYGAATFADLERLPHVTGFVRNLLGERAEIARLAETIHGEVCRRQEIHRQTGRVRLALVIVIEEFSTLLVDAPDFVDVLIKLARVGRTLGVHLVLASGRYEEAQLRGLGTYLSGRIALRTFSTVDSRAVVGVPDAYQLPTEPGLGLLRTGSAAPVPFRAAYPSGPYRRPGPPTWNDVLREARSFGPPTVLDVLVGRIARHGN